MKGNDNEIADVLAWLDAQMTEFDRLVSFIREVDEDVEFAIPEETALAVSAPMVGSAAPCFAIRG